ncbi:MAG TPA: 50S ribosomal protein L3 [Candidatus Deferrimicrobiaceae bacterium]|jgi:large subunit ribosomal protein L3
MTTGILGKKLGMTQVFDTEGKMIPVTVIEAGPCTVIQKKTVQNDGYEAIQIGFQSKKAQKVNKADLGHFRTAGKGAFAILQEVEIPDPSIEVGAEIKVDIFKEGDFVDVSGQSKGRGFTGVMKRWNFRGGRATHGSMFHRAPGSIGASAYPSRVIKNMKMAGHYGNEKTTTLNLKVVAVQPEKNLLLVRGAVPGSKNGMVFVRHAVKKAN